MFGFAGYDFTTAITSEGNVYVWGRNDKHHLGIELDVCPAVTRKFVFKTAKGPSRTLEMPVDNSCLCRPTKFPLLVASPNAGSFFVNFVYSKFHEFDRRRFHSSLFFESFVLL